MKLVFWHGYLLTDTGSNIYTREITRACTALGHEVTLLCQDPDPRRHVGAGVRVLRPEIGKVLPVFVVDRYADLEARHVGDLTDQQLDGYVAANAEAVRKEVRHGVEFVLANHAVMGGPVARAGCAGTGVPFGVYVHGSELEYAIRSRPRLAQLARASLEEAAVIFVGSEHIRRVTEELLGGGTYLDRVVLLPPGVDVEAFHPDNGSLAALVESLRPPEPTAPAVNPERAPDPDAAERLEEVGEFVLYFGKLMRQKGVDLLLEAWRELQRDHPDVTLVIVGFGDDRALLEQQATGTRSVFTGAMSHAQLGSLIPLARAVVVPSVLPEAFGMVAAESAACGVVPLVAGHSGLAEVAEGLGEAGMTFAPSDVDDLRAKLHELLALPEAERDRLGDIARERVVAQWSWPAVATRMVDALAERTSPARS